jgi:hypothetical protein
MEKSISDRHLILNFSVFIWKLLLSRKHEILKARNGYYPIFVSNLYFLIPRQAGNYMKIGHGSDLGIKELRNLGIEGILSILID